MGNHISVLILLLSLSLGGCDRIYGVLHKPGGEERQILGAVVFNEYSPKVEELQKLLKLLGYNIGRADGKFGSGTREAVAKFQADEGLEATRFVDKLTWEHLQSYQSGPFFHKGQIHFKSVQQALRKAGYDPGKMDGMMGRGTRDAIIAFQKNKGLDPDGHLGLKTMKALVPYAPSRAPSATVNAPNP
jgi:peptidoglycan hydrolase-like protein with peptidoglycan-binding domain